MPVIDSRGFFSPIDFSGFERGVGDLLSQQKTDELLPLAQQGDQSALAKLASINPRAAQALMQQSQADFQERDLAILEGQFEARQQQQLYRQAGTIANRALNIQRRKGSAAARAFIQQQAQQVQEPTLKAELVDSLNMDDDSFTNDLMLAVDQAKGFSESGNVQQAVAIPGIGFQTLSQGGEASLVQLTPEQQSIVQAARKAEIEREQRISQARESGKLTAQQKGLPGVKAAVVEAEGAAQAETPTGQVALTKARQRLEKEGQQIQAQKKSVITDSEAAIAGVDRLLKGDVFKNIFGSLQGRLPTVTADSTDAEADLDQILGLLSLEARQKLKGQGTITDSEAATLERSTSVLANRTISDKAARRELNRIRSVFKDARLRSLEGFTATNPETGKKVVFRNGKWKPI